MAELFIAPGSEASVHCTPIVPKTKNTSAHTTFEKTYTSVHKLLSGILTLARTHQVPLNIIGGGSNILIPDTMLRGLTIYLGNIRGITIAHSTDGSLERNHYDNDATQNIFVTVMSGESITHLTTYLANQGIGGIEFLYGMPGTVGGAVWMNARCYGHEISEIFVSAKGITLEGNEWSYEYCAQDFSYKHSPFQDNEGIILACTLRMRPSTPHKLWPFMLSCEFDRRAKGHYLAPCAGSVFKNNHKFGSPSGTLLDTLHWKGTSIGGAMVNPLHANIIINTGNATSREIYTLSERMQRSVYDKYHFCLEHEIVLMGDPQQWHSIQQ